MDVGVRVVRGPNWIWDDQDGECCGTVIRPFESSFDTVQSGTVFVQWDTGSIGNYRVGKDGEYDLLILDSAPGGIRFPQISCDGCGQKDLIGTRWKCSVCENFDLCHVCYHNDKHDLMHAFERIDSSSFSQTTKVPPRANSEKSEVHGIFPGAIVLRRAEDWLHGENDGGMGGIPGTVLEDSPLQPCSRGNVMVLWENGETVKHCCGNGGKVAIMCITPAASQSYYFDHLALLEDKFMVRSQSLPEVFNEENDSPLAPSEVELADPNQFIDKGQENFFLSYFQPGDRVQVNLDVSVFHALQDAQHGGWNVEMELCIGATGVVLEANPQIAVVNYKGLKRRWAINPVALTKKLIAVGDQVRISSDEQKVRSLQRNYGGWVQKMKDDLGKTADVVGFSSGGKVLVKVRGRPYKWTLNLKCCTLIEPDSESGFPEDSNSNDSDSDSENPSNSLFGQSYHSEIIRPELLVQFSAKNQVALVRAIVERYPNQINVRNNGKTALHLSCLKGYAETVRTLLDAGADPTATDDEGNTPVHYSVYRKDNPRILAMLLDRGPWADLVNFKLLSVLHLSVHRQHPQCVRTLIEKGCNINLQDQSGDTALHDAINIGHKEIISYLLECRRFNFAIVNNRGLNILQLSAVKGDHFMVEKIIEMAPELVNQQNEDGMSTLHFACIADHRDAAEILIKKDKTSMELKNRAKHTPLMVALSKAKIATVELLTMEGANVNTSDADGETCLHWILKMITSFQMRCRSQKDMPVVDLYDAPEITSIVTRLPSDVPEATWVGVALFLVKHGANLYQLSNSGNIPLQLTHDQTIVTLLLEAHEIYQRLQKSRRQDTSEIPRQHNPSVRNSAAAGPVSFHSNQKH